MTTEENASFKTLWQRCRVIRPKDGLTFSCWLPHPAPEPNSEAALECGTRVIVLEHDMLWADEKAKQRCHEVAEALARQNLGLES